MADLTPSQYATIKANILASPDLVPPPGVPDASQWIADKYNLPAAPNFTVWKLLVSINEIGDKFDGAELAGLSSLNNTRLQTIAEYSAGGINPSLANRRKFFDDVFSGAGGVLTRANLLALWKRLATRIEKLLANGAGAGTDASPATLTFEGPITASQVEYARNLP